jgi:hypothetical protein
MLVDEEEIIIRRNVLFFDLSEPLKAFNIANSHNERINRAGSLKDNHFLRRQARRLRSYPRFARSQCLL